MGLRSRKPGVKESREDFERQLEERADKPLYQMHVQTEAFNMMFRDFLLKLSMALIVFSLYAISQHLENKDHAIFDVVSLLYFIFTSIWVSRMDSSKYVFWNDKFFRVSAVLMVGQVAFFAYYVVEQNYVIDKEFFPTSAMFALLLVGSLAHMRGSIGLIEKSRAELHSVHEKLNS